MAESWLSVGIDVGTTTTQLVVSRITAENRASSFAVPSMEITGRELLYESPVRFTPLLSGELVDGDAIRDTVAKEYAAAGITREQVSTGAIIITGETSRKENAEAVLRSLSGFAGEFVVATAGPDLESVLAARGAGAVEYSRATGRAVLHMDIGGGTSNLALIRDGRITATGCLNVGGRLVKLDGDGRITYLSPVLRGILPHRPGELLSREDAAGVASLLCGVLEQAAGLRPREENFAHFVTEEASGVPQDIPPDTVLSFSGGVADCIGRELPWLAYGDLGPLLGSAIEKSPLCRREHRLGTQTIRATVIGAGCHSAQLSGSTVYLRNARLPLQNLPVAALTEAEQDREDLPRLIRERLAGREPGTVLSLPGWTSPSYPRVTALADAIAQAVTGELRVVVRADMAKALGHALALRTDRPIVCLDNIRLSESDYLDIGTPLTHALPVVVKTLILNPTPVHP